MKEVLLVGIGGAAGSMLRYVGSQLVQRNYPGQFPMGTMLVNLTGCFLIGLLLGYLGKHQGLSSEWKFLLITGFCGGYTTFSSFAAENLQLIQNQQYGQAFLYIAISVLIGLAAVFAGLYLSKLAS